MEFNLCMSEDREMELQHTGMQVEGLMSDDVVIGWLMRLEQHDAASDMADEILLQPARKTG